MNSTATAPTPPRFPAHVAARIAASHRPARANSAPCPSCDAVFASTDCTWCRTGRYAPLSPAEIAALVARYVAAKATSDRLGSIPAPELSQDDWRTLWDADDEANRVYGRLSDACAIGYLPVEHLPHHLKHLAKALPASANPGDSDPDADELLKRARNPRSGLSSAVDAARLRVEIETAYVLRDRQPIDAYNEWAAEAVA